MEKCVTFSDEKKKKPAGFFEEKNVSKFSDNKKKRIITFFPVGIFSFFFFDLPHRVKNRAAFFSKLFNGRKLLKSASTKPKSQCWKISRSETGMLTRG